MTLTDAELDAVRRLAATNRCSVADVLRLGAQAFVAILDEDPSICPIATTARLVFIIPPEARELLPGVILDESR
ncbi:MAG: hypothetical protein IT180_19020 [Acidobacteria bacterium]|nr:hypothetical protein [Acidobacteriota bacterium]